MGTTMKMNDTLGKLTRIAAPLLCALIYMSGCETTWFKTGTAAVQKWTIAHRPQIEQTLYYGALNVGQDALKAFVGGYANGKFSLAAGLQSIEGNYTSPAQVQALIGVWTPNTAAFNQAAAVIAADLANHPPKNKDQAVAILEGYVKGLQGGTP